MTSFFFLNILKHGKKVKSEFMARKFTADRIAADQCRVWVTFLSCFLLKTEGGKRQH